MQHLSLRDNSSITVAAQPKETTETIGGLPREVLTMILQCLPYKQLVSCSRLNKLWRYLGTNQDMWKAIIQRDFPQLPVENSLYRMCLKGYLIAQELQNGLKVSDTTHLTNDIVFPKSYFLHSASGLFILKEKKKLICIEKDFTWKRQNAHAISFGNEIITCLEGKVRIRDLEGKLLKEMPEKVSVGSCFHEVGTSPDGNIIVIWEAILQDENENSLIIYCWDRITDKITQIHAVDLPKEIIINYPNSVAVSQNHELIAATFFGSLLIFDREGHQLSKHEQNSIKSIYANQMRFALDDTHIAFKEGAFFIRIVQIAQMPVTQQETRRCTIQ